MKAILARKILVISTQNAPIHCLGDHNNEKEGRKLITDIWVENQRAAYSFHTYKAIQQKLTTMYRHFFILHRYQE